jgi:predicted transglutaminase-like cysteine proteinase
LRRVLVALLVLALFGPATPARADCPPVYIGDKENTETVNNIDLTAFEPFCKIEINHPICKGSKGGMLSKAAVEEIDTDLRKKFIPRTDKSIYGVTDVWTSISLCGDCEDYALHMARVLAERGVDGRNIILLAWMPSRTTAHATLAVKTTEGWIELGILDEDKPQILDWYRGRRYAWMRMDGHRKWVKVPATLPKL